MIYRMKWLIGTILVLTVFKTENSMAVPQNNNVALRIVSSRLNQFSTHFYRTSSKSIKDNLICSPLSAGIVLSMASYGARGDTENQMRSSLRIPKNDAVGKEGFPSLLDTFHSVKKVELKLAQKIFTTTGFEMKSDFKDIMETSFQSAIQSLDFNKTSESSRTINKWCEEQTNQKIKDIVQPDDLKGAAMVLINAVYFKGNWLSKFNADKTELKPFYVDGKRTKNVKMMYQRQSFNYGHLPELDAIFVELPYERENTNDAISMFLIRPNKDNGLAKASKLLHHVNFKNLHQRSVNTEMHLYVPKFRIESTLQLQPVLEKMGMIDMFTDNANFTGITDFPPLKVSKVVQKAFIEVNEEGSEAAAVTAAILTLKSASISPPLPITVKIDRSFIYAIVHSATNVVLFQGHIFEPTF